MDIVSKEKRSEMMSKIRHKDTKNEIIVRHYLHQNGIRYRKNVKMYGCNADMYVSKYNVIVEINGCYFHRHQGCKLAYKPKTRVKYYRKKFAYNVNRDKEKIRIWIENGLRVLIIWECQIRSKDRLNNFEILFEEIKNPDINQFHYQNSFPTI